jgi:hypothetical protein
MPVPVPHGEAPVPVVDPSDVPTPEEARLAVEIERLWAKHVTVQATFDKINNEHTKAQGSYRKSRAELKEVRDKLSKLLHEIKPLISRPGCGGGWSSFLVEHQIPRSSADGLVRKFEKAIAANAEGNCSTEQITEQPETAIRRYLKRQWPRLNQLVKAPEDLEMFITALKETAAKSFDADGDAPDSSASDVAVQTV